MLHTKAFFLDGPLKYIKLNKYIKKQNKHKLSKVTYKKTQTEQYNAQTLNFWKLFPPCCSFEMLQ